jgi:hypothetical protein
MQTASLCDFYFTPPSSAEVKNGWSYISSPSIRLHGMELSYAQRQIKPPIQGVPGVLSLGVKRPVFEADH